MKEGGMEQVTGTTYWAKRKRRHGILQKKVCGGRAEATACKELESEEHEPDCWQPAENMHVTQGTFEILCNEQC
jgi:hypothetical protein